MHFHHFCTLCCLQIPSGAIVRTKPCKPTTYIKDSSTFTVVLIRSYFHLFCFILVHCTSLGTVSIINVDSEPKICHLISKAYTCHPTSSSDTTILQCFMFISTWHFILFSFPNTLVWLLAWYWRTTSWSTTWSLSITSTTPWIPSSLSRPRFPTVCFAIS